MKIKAIHELISEEALAERIKEMGAQITKDYEGKTPHMIGILKGGVYFLCDLSRAVELDTTIDFMCISSYGAGTESSGEVRILKDLDEPLEGKDVLVVEDIIDTGNTLQYLMRVLKDRNPNSLKLCTLLDKPERRLVDDVFVDYVGFTIPDEFVVGCGLDCNQQYRTLPYIGAVELE